MAGRCHKSRRRGCEFSIFVVKTLAVLFVGYNMLPNQFSERAKGIGNQPIWPFYIGPDMYVKMDHECLPVLKRITKSGTTCET